MATAKAANTAIAATILRPPIERNAHLAPFGENVAGLFQRGTVPSLRGHSGTSVSSLSGSLFMLLIATA